MAAFLSNFIYSNIELCQNARELAEPCSRETLLPLGFNQATPGGAIKVNLDSSCLVTPWKPLYSRKNPGGRGAWPYQGAYWVKRKQWVPCTSDSSCSTLSP